MPCFLTVISSDGFVFKENMVMLMWSTKLQKLISECDMTKLMMAVVEIPKESVEAYGTNVVLDRAQNTDSLRSAASDQGAAGGAGCGSSDTVVEPYMEEDCCTIRLPMVSGDICRRVFEWIDYHIDHPPMHGYNMPTFNERTENPPYEIPPWDDAFFDVEIRTLLLIMNAAIYLGIAGLFNMACKCAANKLYNKTPAELRQLLGLNDESNA